MDRTIVATILGDEDTRESYFNPTDVLTHIEQRHGNPENPILLPIKKESRRISILDYDPYDESKSNRAELIKSIVTDDDTNSYFESLSERGPNLDYWLYKEILGYLNFCENNNEWDAEEKKEADMEIRKTIACYFLSQLNDKNNDVYVPDINIARLRRTALYLYKIVQIPGIQVNSGTFKSVYGPYGLTDSSDELISEFEKNIRFTDERIYQWDGRIPVDSKLENRPVPVKLVRIIPNNSPPLYGSMHDDESIVSTNVLGEEGLLPNHIREVYVSERLRKILPDKLRPMIPEYRKIIGRLTNTQAIFAEYVPSPLWEENTFPINPNENPMKVLRIAELISELASNKIYVTDIKPNNFRIREDGTPVLIDLGEVHEYRSGLGPNRDFLVPLYGAPPESNHMVNELHDMEKIEVFEMAVLLLHSIFISSRSIFIDSKFGLPDEAQNPFDPDYTIVSSRGLSTVTHDMIDKLFDINSIGHRNLSLIGSYHNKRRGFGADYDYYREGDFKQLIFRGTNPDPENRIGLHEFTRRLKDIMERRKDLHAKFY